MQNDEVSLKPQKPKIFFNFYNSLRFSSSLTIIIAVISISNLQCRGFELTCEFTDIPYGWGPFINPTGEFKCVMKNVMVQTRDQIITSTNNNENLNVTKLYAENQTIHFLPARIDKFFPFINEVQIINSALKFIDRYEKIKS